MDRVRVDAAGGVTASLSFFISTAQRYRGGGPNGGACRIKSPQITAYAAHANVAKAHAPLNMQHRGGPAVHVDRVGIKPVSWFVEPVSPRRLALPTENEILRRETPSKLATGISDFTVSVGRSRDPVELSPGHVGDLKAPLEEAKI